jgi:hypothetical protein
MPQFIGYKMRVEELKDQNKLILNATREGILANLFAITKKDSK